jgi:amidohydrolase
LTGGDPGAEIFRAAARDRTDLVVDLRRELHRIPEMALQEVKTTRLVSEFLAAREIPFEATAAGTGGIAVIGRGDPVVILRADLDALPIREETGHDFSSTHAGVMHACGHDAHTAMLLAAADALHAGAVPFRGSVICMFQPAEEGPGGCLAMLEEGLLERHPAHAAVALHVWPRLPTGAVGLSAGPITASMDRLRLLFRGKGGHGAHPQNCIDPVVMAAEAVLALQTLVSRRTDPFTPALLTLGSIHGGTAPNIIPDVVELEGTIRCYEADVRKALLAGIEQVGRGVAAAHGGQFEWAVGVGYPMTHNDPQTFQALAGSLEGLLGLGAVRPSTRTMGAEDMSYLLERVPGCYLQLGCSADPDAAEPLHSPRFDFDEGCLPVGVSVLLAAVHALSCAGSGG